MNELGVHIFPAIDKAIKEELSLLTEKLAAANLTISNLTAEKQQQSNYYINLCNALGDTTHISYKHTYEIDSLIAENKQELSLLTEKLVAANLTISNLTAEKQQQTDLNTSLCDTLKDANNRSLEHTHEIVRLTAENTQLRNEIASHDDGRKNMAKKEIALMCEISKLENENKKITEMYMLERAEHDKLKTQVQTAQFDAFGRRT
jgi:chromosome segregation ATPase